MAPLVISTLALAFTVFSFWWLQARRGRLQAFEPSSFAAAIAGDQSTLLRLPVILYNSGARTRVVRMVRLVLATGDTTEALAWRTFRATIDPRKDDVADLPSPYTIQGRSADARFIEFGARVRDGLLEPVERSAVIEVLLDGSTEWKRVGAFPLRLWHWQHPDIYIAYPNSLDPCRTDETEVSRTAMLREAQKRNVSLDWLENEGG